MEHDTIQQMQKEIDELKRRTAQLEAQAERRKKFNIEKFIDNLESEYCEKMQDTNMTEDQREWAGAMYRGVMRYRRLHGNTSSELPKT